MTAVKIVVSALIILGINILAKKSPSLGGWVAALPIISLLSAVWLFVDQKPSVEIADFLQGVVWGLIPTALLLLVVVFGLRSGLNLAFAMLLGIGAWGVYTWTVKSVFA